VTEFADTAACAIIKHNNPCGVAISARSAEDAYQTAFNADPLSAFGGIVGFNRPVDAATAAHLKEVFLELIVAPEFTPEALDILQSKKNLRLVRRPLYEGPAAPQVELKQVTSELFLLQRVDEEKISQPLTESLNVVSEKKPTPEQLADMEFAWKVAKHVKSNAIVVAKDGRTLGIGGGQTSRIAAMEQALARACDETKDAVVASDGFFPAVDNIHAAAQSRIGAIVQPGGSIKDADVLAEANRYGIAMATTGIREFKH
jgi:phosphoribosylaminoimidazolecarboxamide formyltransferase/IMP cyclohydrolase